MKQMKLFLVALMVLVVPACSIGGGLDMEEVETEISAGIQDQTGTEIESVDCPDEMDAEEGNNFECDVVATTGETATVTVTQTDDDGNVEWEITGE